MTDTAELLRRALKAHDRIVAAYRAGGRTPGKAIDDMKAVKDEARALGLYPSTADLLREVSS